MSESDHWIFETDEAVQEVDGNPRPPVPSGLVGDPGSPSKSKAPISIAVWSAAIWFAIDSRTNESGTMDNAVDLVLLSDRRKFWLVRNIARANIHLANV